MTHPLKKPGLMRNYPVIETKRGSSPSTAKGVLTGKDAGIKPS